MKIKELIYQTPEMSEEKLLNILDKYIHHINSQTTKRLYELYNNRHKGEPQVNLSSIILEEWDLIQDKKSLLTKSQRDEICGLVGMCLIQMTQKDEN